MLNFIKNMNISIKHWWFFLIIISIINVGLILLTLQNVKSNFEMKLFYLAFIYILVNSVRGIWLREDIQRLCLHNNTLSSPLIGRVITTVSEISFVLLIVLIFKQIVNTSNHNPNIHLVLNFIILAIVIAEIFCWKGCLSTEQYWNMLEESTWTLSSFLIMVISIFMLFNEKNITFKRFLYITIFATILYQIFMITVDIPMYYNRSNNVTTEATDILSQVNDMADCKIISESNDYWDQEIPWLTGYFTFGSWIAIILVIWYQNNKSLFK